SEDANMSKLQFKKAAREATEPIAKEIAAKLPGTNDPLPAVKLMPEQDRYPLGLEYLQDQAFGLKIGPAAFAFYHVGEKRYRLVVLARDNAEAAKQAFAAIKGKAKGQPVNGLGEEAASGELPGADAAKKLEGVFARTGAIVMGIIDDEFGENVAGKKLS